VSEVGNI